MSCTLVYFLYFGNSRAHKILAAAKVAGVNVDQKMIELPVSEEYKKNCSPLGGNPVLQTPDGYIFESNAILRYIARLDKTNTLYGSSIYENSMVDAWLDFCCSELDPITNHVGGAAIFGKPLPEDFLDATEAVLAGLESWLETRTYLVGEKLTIADIAVAFGLQPFFRHCEHCSLLADKFKNCCRLYNTVMAVEVIGALLKELGTGAGVPSAEEKADIAARCKALGEAFLARAAAAAAAAEEKKE